MKALRLAAVLAVTAATMIACESDSGDPLAIDATGNVSGLVFIDRNGNGTLDAQVDGPAANVSVALVAPVSLQTVARATSNASGIFSFTDIPVGRYGVTIESPTLGDSLRLAKIDSTTITVAARDTSVTLVTLGYQQVPISGLGNVPIGRRVNIQGVALNAWSAFGDSTLHVADSTGVIRAVRVLPATIAAGDTVRLLGTVARINNALTLSDATAFRVGTGTLTRVPAPLTTAQAATANGNALQNDLVRITRASIVNTQQQPNGEITASVDDGSGIVQVVLDASGGFGGVQNIIPGALLDATGLLVPRENGTGYILKPRNTADISVGFEQVTVAQARQLPVGRLVQLEGLALNGWITFNDSTVHVVDPTGAIRATRVVQSTLFAGDSVRMVGRIALRDGQTVLAFVQPTVLLTNRTLPPPHLPKTGEAATANNGSLDAALVQIRGVDILDTATVGRTQTYPGNFVIGVNDGTGRLEIVILPALGLRLTSYVPNTRIDATGVLVPVPGGTSWQVRPRSASDIVIVQPPPPPPGGGS